MESNKMYSIKFKVDGTLIATKFERFPKGKNMSIGIDYEKIYVFIAKITIHNDTSIVPTKSCIYDLHLGMSCQDQMHFVIFRNLYGSI